MPVEAIFISVKEVRQWLLLEENCPGTANRRVAEELSNKLRCEMETGLVDMDCWIEKILA